MRRRFGRGRRGRGGPGPRNATIDTRCFEQIVEAKIVSAESLEPVASDDVPDHYAALAIGSGADGRALIVAYSPVHGGDAALAGVAHAQRRIAEGGFDGEVIAVSPQWTGAARRRLAFVGAAPFRFRAVAASALRDGDDAVEAEGTDVESWVPAARVGARLGRAADRELFARALAALEGLAAKHGGVVRSAGARVELVLLAGRVASLETHDGVTLETHAPDHSRERLDAERLATAFDRLEGSLRKRLNDKRLRAGEEGLRADLWAALAEAEGVRGCRAWPVGGADPQVVDFVGVGADGAPVVGALRERLSLAGVGELLDAIADLQPTLGAVLAEAGAPVRLEAPRLVIAAREFEAGALAVLPVLALDHRTYDVTAGRGSPDLTLRGLGAAAAPSRPAQVEVAEVDAAEAESPAEDAGEARPRGSARRRRGRRGGSRARAEGRSDADGPVEGEGEAESGSIAERAERFESMSLFDLDDDNGDGAPRRPRRSRGRRRRGKATADGSDGGDRQDESPAAADDPGDDDDESAGDGGAARRRRRGRRRRSRTDRESETSADADEADLSDDDDDVVEDDDGIPVVADVDVPDVVEDEPPGYDDDSDDNDDDTSTEEETPERDLRRPRRRAAIVAHADRGSVIAAILLARDLRLIDGFWVYPQSDLMTFFRGVATDLREETPIYLVGFTASRETIGAATLYAGRLAWFDHHDWPPEDLTALKEVLGDKNVTVTPGNESPVAAVLIERTRRSRFSDKIVELGTGRFTQHDFERWGRVWWERLATTATQPGDRRADVDPLLIGRPSDLAREVAKVPVPPPPSEVAFVAGRDFRIVHFGGYRMVVVPVPPEFDLHLSLRVARERYGADMSLGFVEGGELVVLSGDEGRSQRNLDMLSMAAHLESKHDWLEKLASDDYVARIRIHGFPSHPERLDEVISQIAMGRSILEG